jgi:hypothetical protein
MQGWEFEGCLMGNSGKNKSDKIRKGILRIAYFLYGLSILSLIIALIVGALESRKIEEALECSGFWVFTWPFFLWLGIIFHAASYNRKKDPIRFVVRVGLIYVIYWLLLLLFPIQLYWLKGQMPELTDDQVLTQLASSTNYIFLIVLACVLLFIWVLMKISFHTLSETRERIKERRNKSAVKVNTQNK